MSNEPVPNDPTSNVPDSVPAPARRGRSRRFTAAGLTFALVGGGLVTAALADAGPFGAAGRSGGSGGTGSVTNPRTSAVAYSAFPDCRALLGYLTGHAKALVGPYGLPGTAITPMLAARGAAEDTLGGAPAAAGAASGGGAAAPADTRSQTGTNVQVAGVDEADLAKRVGDLIYSAAPSYPGPNGGPVVQDSAGGSLTALNIVRSREGRSTLLGRLTLRDWQPATLLVDGDTVLLIGTAPAQPVPQTAAGAPVDSDRIMPYWGWRQRTRIVQVDVSDPARPRTVASLVVDGSDVGARLVDGVARIAVSGATNRLRFPQPVFGVGSAGVAPDGAISSAGVAPDSPVSDGTGVVPSSDAAYRAAEKKAIAANRRMVAASGIEDWLPTFELTEGDATTPTRTGSLLSCADVSAPSRFSGLDTMSLLTFDLRDPAGISRWDGAGVVATGAQLYATADHTYLATNQWQDWATVRTADYARALRDQRTQIHLFDTTGGASPVYVGSGDVPGFLLNQFSMDEQDGYLRVASTNAPTWWGGRTETPSTSQVTVLRVGDAGLPTVGSVGGLGRTEMIRAVRFLGDVGYVVTFRQTDPLYTIDLSEPARPRVAGELKILGYSAYLHPVGDGLVLGIGQDADSRGSTKGLQLALYDVSDPAAPRRVDRVTLPGAWSDVEGDHHAFTFADGTALVPFTRWSDVATAEVVPEPIPVEPDGGNGSSSGAGSSSGSGAGSSSGSNGSSDPAFGKPVPVQTFDAGVVAVRLTGDGSGARFGTPVVLRAVGSGPTPINPNTGAVGPTPLRTFVGDGSIWTVTSGGIAAHDEQTFTRTDFTAL